MLPRLVCCRRRLRIPPQGFPVRSSRSGWCCFGVLAAKVRQAGGPKAPVELVRLLQYSTIEFGAGVETNALGGLGSLCGSLPKSGAPKATDVDDLLKYSQNEDRRSMEDLHGMCKAPLGTVPLIRAVECF